MIYPADVIREAEEAGKLGLKFQEMEIDFQKIMERTRNSYLPKKERLLKSVEEDENTDFYNETERFLDDYTMEVG